MKMIPGKIRTRLIEEVYANSFEGLVDRGQWKRDETVECDHCGEKLAAGSLEKHLETQHGIFWSLVSLPHTPQGLSPIGSNRHCVVGRDPRAPANKNEIN